MLGTLESSHSLGVGLVVGGKRVGCLGGRFLWMRWRRRGWGCRRPLQGVRGGSMLYLVPYARYTSRLLMR